MAVCSEEVVGGENNQWRKRDSGESSLQTNNFFFRSHSRNITRVLRVRGESETEQKQIEWSYDIRAAQRKTFAQSP
jgi:hypothetical protein